MFCCNHNFFCTFQKSSSIGKDRHSDGDADLPVHCDVILHGADAGRNDGASLVWGCKFFYAFVTYCVTTCSNYELLFHLFSEALTGGNIQKEPKKRMYCSGNLDSLWFFADVGTKNVRRGRLSYPCRRCICCFGKCQQHNHSIGEVK